MLAERQGRYADALGHAEQALRLYQAIGDKASEADALNNVGWYHGLLGDYQQARAFCRQALTLSAEAGHRWLEGYVWDSLGYAEHHLGNLAEAAACYQRALSINGRPNASDHPADMPTQVMMAAAPLLLAPRTDDVLVIGWGSGVSAGTALRWPSRRVTAKLASTIDHASPNPSA